jgi:hypothetical protein
MTSNLNSADLAWRLKLFKKGLLVTALAVIVAATMAIVFSGSSGPDRAHADSPFPEGKKVFQFNYIAVPEGTDPSCGNGARIFTERGAAAQHIYWTLDPAGGIKILDCETEAIDGDVAWITADLAGVYTVYVRLLGPNTSANSLSICRNVLDDPETVAVHDELCELGFVNLSRGGGTDKYTFPKKLFDDGAENELWHMEQGTKFRIAQVRLYLVTP